MGKIRRFLGYPFRFKLLLMEAFVRLVAVSLLLRLTKFSATHRLWLHNSQKRLDPSPLTVDEICRAVTMAARFVPGANCLVQAIVGRSVLRRAGHAAELRIGVSKKSEIFKAHAWVENAGGVVIGGTVDQFTALPQIGRERR
jgi:hypothetical protein